MATTFANVPRSMLRLLVREIAEREGIENPLQLSERAGLPYETCRRVWNDVAEQWGRKTIERLCDALHVRPGQLFDYDPEPDKLERDLKAKGKGKRKG